MTHLALITAKGSNQSIKNKNLIEIEGHSFLAWQIKSAFESRFCESVFISTEDELIKAEARKYGARILNRPAYLAQANSNHGDVILQAYEELLEEYSLGIDTLTILLGNTIAARAEDIDNNIKLLLENDEATSAMTVWKAQDDHPYRAMEINENGFLVSYLKDKQADTNRQSYPDIFFYDQGPWTVKGSTLDKARFLRKGPACWWWMGEKCIPVVRNWVTGRDVHSRLDVEFSRQFLHNNYWNL